MYSVANLPCYMYSVDNVDVRRRNALFAQLISTLSVLNDAGYGRDEKLN